MGTLNGYTVIELAGVGPAPMGGMILADMGAEVIRIDRASGASPLVMKDISTRGKKSVVINLKDPEGVETLLRMLEKADAIIDPFRPGVCEKLGIGPDVCLARNPKLIFARMTGWGQDGPLAHAAGHDINFIALTGALYAVGKKDEKPIVPLNMVGDMGGGGMLLAMGILAALLETSRSGKGQVIDAAMVDGVAQIMSFFHGLQHLGMWDANHRESNQLDGGAHYYDTYECSDGEFIAIGAVEAQFYALLKEKLNLPENEFHDQDNRDLWPEMSNKLAAIFKQKTQAQWCELLEGTDACFSPVLNFMDAPNHPANKTRNTYIELDGIVQPAPAPRFSRTPSQVKNSGSNPGDDTTSTLASMGFQTEEIEALRNAGSIV